MRPDSINRIAISSTARTPSTESFEKAPDLASPCCPSKENSCFKENININKSGASNLSLDPQQMKRKKKGGKNNLRKSLAWDRAFFTEEGVLDPLELSAISGVSCGGGLPFISEDNLVRSGQDIHSRNDKENDLSPPKLNLSSSSRMASTSLPSHKAPKNTGSKLGSKYADCPRASPSPSLKRRANANVGKALGSELRLPKVPGLKPGLSPTCASTRSTILRGSRAKQNQITQPDFSIQRDMELNSYLKSNTKNAQNTSRPTAFQSARHSNGDLGSSSFNRHVSIDMIPMTVDKVNSDSKMTPLNVTQIRRESSCNSQPYDSATFASSYSQNAHVNVKTLPPLQNQTTKPSGLRKPSPSLSFFSQPKPSSYRDLPLRGIHLDVYGSQNRGSLRLLDNLSRTTKLHDRIPDSRISSSKAICSRSEFTASSHVSVIDLAKPKLDQKPMHEVGLDTLSDVSYSHSVHTIFEDSKNVFDGQIQELPKKNEIVRISREEAEVSSQNGSRNHSMDNFFKKNIDDCPVKGESCESEWSNSELASEQNYAIPESQTINAADEQPAKNKICNILVLNHDSTQCTDGFDDRVQNTSAMHSDWNKTSCKPDYHEAHLEITDPLFLGENEKRTDKSISQERATEKMNMSQQKRIYSIENMKASERREAMAASPCFESNHLYAVKILIDNLPEADAQMQDSVFASIVERCNNDTKLMPEVDNDINQTGESSEAQDFGQKVAVEPMPEVDNDINQTGESSEAQDFHQKVAVEPRHIGKLNKRLSHQNLQHEENVDELLLEASDRKDGNKVIHAKLSFSQSFGKRRKNNLGKEAGMARPLKMDECDSVGNSFSSESCNSPVSTSFDSVENGLSSTMSLKDSESDIDTLKSLQCTETLLVQSLESNMLNNCCFQQSECMTLAGDEFDAENLVLRNDSVPAKHLPNVFSEDNTVGSMKTSLTQEEVCQVISRSSNLARESPLKSEICNEVFETGGAIEDTITDSSRVSFSDTINVGVSLDDNNSLSCLRPKWDCDKVESTLLPNNVHGDGLEEKKSLSVVIPPNATPFSDEWLAAIEAAGEDILTKKSGAVQNSPPDKSVPEPSPWSPVKRKNNQIGPFDCTKKLAAASQP